MEIRELARKAWEDKQGEREKELDSVRQQACESALRSFGRLTGDDMAVAWLDDDGYVKVNLAGLTFRHVGKPHTWWMLGNCPECGEVGWSVQFKEDGLWQVGALLEQFEIPGHTCPVEEVVEEDGEPTAAEQLKKAVVRIINEWEG